MTMGRVSVLRMFRFPGAWLALFGASAILGAVTAAGEPFLSSTASATLHRSIEADAAYRIPVLTVSADSSISSDVIAFRTGLLERELGPVLGDPIVTVRGDAVTAAANGTRMDVRIVSRSGALEHVRTVEGSGDDGVWLADVTASSLGVGSGDVVELDGIAGTTEVTVAGIYADLMTTPRTPFWAPLDDFVYPPPNADVRPPAFVLMDLPTYLSVNDRLLDDQDVFTWEFPLPREPTSIEDAEALRSRLARFRTTLSNSTGDIGLAFRRSNVDEPYSGWLSSTRQVATAVAGPVDALVLAARVLALAVLAGSGLFMTRRRRVEIQVLNARGVGPVRLGARTVAEVALPVALGALAGWGVALGAVGLGSGGVVSETSMRAAAVAVAWSALVAIVVLGLVTARSLGDSAVAGAESRPVPRAASFVPWDVILLVLAAVAYVGVRERPGSEAGQAPADLAPLFLLFPVLLLAGAAGLLARAVRVLLPPLRRFGDRWPAGAYLAVRRLAVAPRLASSLLTAVAVAVGVLVYAGTLTSSLAEGATQAAGLQVGGDVSVSHSGTLSGTEGAPVPTTSIVRVEDASFVPGSDVGLDVLLVNPATFAEGAFWRSEFADVSLETLMDRIDEPNGGAVPAIVAGVVRVPADPVISVGGVDVPIRVVGAARTFPGIVGDRPVVVMTRDAMEAAAGSSGVSLAGFADGYEVWGRGTEAEVRSFVTSRGATPLSSSSAAELRETPRYLAVVSMLRFLQALGIVAASVVLIGGYLYLQSRQRQAETSYALARRMGLSPGSHRRSVALEVGALLGVAAVLGGTIAAVASLVVNGDVQARAVDVAVPLFRIPLPLLAATAGASLLFALAGAGLVQRRADRADVAEVMRVAD